VRGRKPCEMLLRPEDVPILEALVHSGKTEQRVAKRAGILLGLAAGKRTAPIAGRVERDEATVWRVARRYEARGLQAVYDAPRSGRPRRVFPPGANADRESGLHKAGRSRAVLDPLVGADTAAGGDQTRDPRHDPLHDGGPHPCGSLVAASSVAILEDDGVGRGGNPAGEPRAVVLRAC